MKIVSEPLFKQLCAGAGGDPAGAHGFRDFIDLSFCNVRWTEWDISH
jgi:hypothetical protein